jgi:flagellar basal-body rod modification protein FlgD
MSSAPIGASSSNYPAQQYGNVVEGLDNSRSSLSQEDFLELLSVQFQQQDPFNPTSDTEFMAQMAQFNALEQMSSLNKSFGVFSASAEFATASELIGKEVAVETKAGTTVSGPVESAIKRADGVVITVGGVEYPLSSVQAVQQATVQGDTGSE